MFLVGDSRTGHILRPWAGADWEEATMPRVHYMDLDLDLSFLGSEFDEITLQIWGRRVFKT